MFSVVVFALAKYFICNSKLFVSVCRSASSASDTYLYLVNPTGSILNLSIFAKVNLLLHYISTVHLG